VLKKVYYYDNWCGGIGTTAPSTLLHILAADNTTAQTITINAAQASVTALDTFIDFRSTTGSEGSIAGTATAGVIAYNTFTGSHWTKIEDKDGLEPNMLLEAINAKFNENKGQLVKARLCTSRKSPAVYGVYGGTDEQGRDLVLALGTGYIWVTNTNGNIVIGDYLQSSTKPGFAERQDDDVLHNYTVAKALEPVIWKKGEVKRLIACTYHSG
jgi:hypothetical protein